MPGALLKGVGLPYHIYKGGRRAWERRTCICGGLAAQSGLDLPKLCRVQMGCWADGDCLDVVVAAVGVAMWRQGCRWFRHSVGGARRAPAQRDLRPVAGVGTASAQEPNQGDGDGGGQQLHGDEGRRRCGVYAGEGVGEHTGNRNRRVGEAG